MLNNPHRTEYCGEISSVACVGIRVSKLTSGARLASRARRLLRDCGGDYIIEVRNGSPVRDLALFFNAWFDIWIDVGCGEYVAPLGSGRC